MKLKSERLRGKIILCIFIFMENGDKSKLEESKEGLLELAKMWNININTLSKSTGDFDLHFHNFLNNKNGYADSIEPFYQILNNQ